MSENTHKDADKTVIFTVGPQGSPPAVKNASPPEPELLNPGPKLALLALALIIMGGYACFAHNFDAYWPGGSGVQTRSGSGGREVPVNGTRQSGDASEQAKGHTQTQNAERQNTGTEAQTGGEDARDAAQQALEAEAHRQKLAKYNRSPRMLSSKSFTGESFAGLSLASGTVSQAVFDGCDLSSASFSKMRFKDCTFRNTDLSKIYISESTFENCIFEGSNIDEATLFSINFLNCSFKGEMRGNNAHQARIYASRVSKVTFEKAELENFSVILCIGQATFKDSDLSGLLIRADHPDHLRPKVSATDDRFDLYLEGCTGGDFSLIVNYPSSSSLKISKCDFDNAKLHSFTNIEITDSAITGNSYLAAKEWIVAKKSRLCASFTARKAIYMVDNAYEPLRNPSRVNQFVKDDDGFMQATSLKPDNGAECYVIGGKDGAWLNIYGGKTYISDLKIRFGYFEWDHSRAPTELNMKNVELDKGYIFNHLLDAAYWENVKILNTIISRGQASVNKHLAVQGVDVSAPAGGKRPENWPGNWIDDSRYYSMEKSQAQKWPKPDIPAIKKY